MARVSIPAVLCLVLTTPWVRAEIPQSPDATTQAEYNINMLDFGLRTITDVYLERGSRDPKWDEPTVNYMIELARYFAKAESYKSRAEIIEEGERLLGIGCDEPFVKYGYAAMGEDEYGKNRHYDKLLAEAIDGMIERGYPPHRIVHCAHRLWMSYRDDEPAKADRYLSIAIEHLMATLTSENLVEDDEWGVIVNDFASNVTEWVKYANPMVAINTIQELEQLVGANEWAREAFLGEFHISIAWAARGGGWASTVTEQGWDDFRDHLALARKHLTKAWELRQDEPRPAGRMIYVCLGDSEDPVNEGRLWFDRAVTAQFDYEYAYDTYEWLLRPRWYGSHEQMYRFGVECARTKRFETDVPWELIEILKAIVSDRQNRYGYGSYRQWTFDGVFENARIALEGRRDRPGKELYRNYYHEQIMALAHQCGRPEEAWKLMQGWQWGPNENAFTPYGTRRDTVIAAAAAAAGPWSQDIQAAHALAMSGDLKAALEAYEALAEKELEPRPLQHLIVTRIQAIRWHRDFKDDKVLDLSSSDELAGWTNVHGDWSAEEGGKLVGVASDDGLVLACAPHFGTSWELTGRFTYAAGTARPQYAMVVLGYSEDWHEWPAVVFDPRDNDVRLATIRRGYNDATTRNVAVSPQTNEFRIVRMDDRVSVWLNGKQVFSRQRMNGLDGRADKIAIGGRYSAPGDVIFSELAIRAFRGEQVAPPPPQLRPEDGPPPAPI